MRREISLELFPRECLIDKQGGRDVAGARSRQLMLARYITPHEGVGEGNSFFNIIFLYIST